MKKYLGLILSAVAFIFAGCCFLTLMGPAVTVSWTVLGKTTSSSMSGYDMISNGGGLYIAAIVHVGVALALIACVFALDAVKAKFKFKKLVSFLPAIVLIVAAVDFFLAIPCLNMMNSDDVNEAIGYVGKLVDLKKSLGFGAIGSGALAILASLTMICKTLRKESRSKKR